MDKTFSMREHRIDLVVILIISIGSAVLVPNFIKHSSEIEIVGLSDFIVWTLIIFVLLTLSYFAVKPPVDNETKKNMTPLPDGYQELYNEKNQITRKGFFISGKLVNGFRHVYKGNGRLSRIEIYKDGVYMGDSEKRPGV